MTLRRSCDQPGLLSIGKASANKPKAKVGER